MRARWIVGMAGVIVAVAALSVGQAQRSDRPRRADPAQEDEAIPPFNFSDDPAPTTRETGPRMRWQDRGRRPMEGSRMRAGPLREPGQPPGPGEGPEGPPGDRPGGPMFGPRPEQIEQAMQFLEESYPVLYRKLRALHERDPQAFRAQLHRIMPRLPELMEIRRRNPELGKAMFREHQLEMQIEEAVIEYRRARSDAEKAEIKKQIQALVSEQFDVRQEKLRLMIAQLEQELEQKKKALSERASKKEQFIELDVERRLNPDL